MILNVSQNAVQDDTSDKVFTPAQSGVVWCGVVWCGVGGGEKGTQPQHTHTLSLSLDLSLLTSSPLPGPCRHASWMCLSETSSTLACEMTGRSSSGGGERHTGFFRGQAYANTAHTALAISQSDPSCQLDRRGYVCVSVCLCSAVIFFFLFVCL